MGEPLFILNCMRSYSSLACGMIGQHPQLYGLPELNPFIADTLGMTIAALRLARPRSLDGLYRTIAQLEFGEQTDRSVANAKFWLKRRRSWTMCDLLRHVGRAVSPLRFVEKSPSTVLSEDRLERAFAAFPHAAFLHLSRHPRPTCRSISAIVSSNERPKKGRRRLVSRKDPEDAWLKANLNIMRFSRALPPGQFMHVRGEDLLSQPGRYLAQICEWLDLDLNEEALAAMLHPENSVYARIGPEDAPFGNDPTFLRSPEFRQREIPAASLAGPLEWRDDDRGFCPQTIQAARQLGYH